MSTLNLTQGAWDRVMLALAGSIPSLFGALASWAKNARQSRDFNTEYRMAFDNARNVKLKSASNHFVISSIEQ